MSAISYITRIGLTSFFIVCAGLAQAAPKVSLTVSAQKEVKVKKPDGSIAVEKRKAADAAPGEVLSYTIHYSNTGDDSAHNARIDNPVPKGTAYVDGSAWGKNANIDFSIDDGQTYKKPGSLTYTIQQNGKVVKKTAEPEKYTNIRWVVDEIKPGQSGDVGFKVRVK